MSERISLSFSPIAHGALVLLAAAAVVGLTLWPYRRRLRASADRRKWLVVGLRLAAVLLALMASLRPSLLVLQRVRQKVSLIFLVDASTSMKISDEANSRSRWEMALRALDRSRERLGESSDDPDADLAVKYYRFDRELQAGAPDGQAEPEGMQTALGAALLEAVRRESGAPIAALVVLSDGASNAGVAPLTAAQNLRAQGVPVTAVGFGSAAAGAGSRDIAVTGVQAPEAVFVKNEMEVRGALRVRGFAGQDLEVELLAEGSNQPVARTTVRVPADSEVVTTPPLRYAPQASGDQLLTVRVADQDGELLASNNRFSTFVSVLPGGLNVLHLQGPGTIWEGKYVTRALDASREIQANLKVMLGPPRSAQQVEELDRDLMPGAHDVYILGDIPAEFLTVAQMRSLVRAVEGGAGLIMLGGRDSFGDGGWGGTPLAEVLPTTMRQGDGQIEPEGGLKVLPNTQALDSFVLQLAPTPSETASLWQALPPIPGASRIGQPKPSAVVWAQTPSREPLMVAQDGRGRVIAFGGETWPWYRASKQSQDAHRRFWRQAILWLAHQEDRGESRVELQLDRRRVAVGGAVVLTAAAFDDQGRPIPDARFEATITPPDRGAGAPVDLFSQGERARGTYAASGAPGVYGVELIGRAPDGSEIGRASSRFLVFQDDLELENPAANIALLRQVAELTGGQFLRPEQLDQFLDDLDPEAFSRVETQVEYRLWDNWPFLLLFVGVLGVEWVVRKRMGWV
ncbi:VWA domain-containing protein [Tautonia sociabilis]|uniref:VWA domain-containing protein n=1 Tax=Tautonia sociabilis TaxID=2080755 RepID=A0A432MCS3_9BACT|nr:VWA domain-containing protein [Tautonia sociabilis]RUL82209.1 VWA domain-containing protein [Tautonia sociabilis]